MALVSDLHLPNQGNGSLVLEQLTVCPTLFVGIGAFIWTPLSVAIGRRPVFLICVTLLTIGAVVAATAKDFNALLGAIGIQGIAAAPMWSLVSLHPSSSLGEVGYSVTNV